MKNLRWVALPVTAAVVTWASTAQAALVNVALGAGVTSVGPDSPDGVALSTVTDGVFRPRETEFTNGTVFWFGPTVTLQIDLGGAFDLVGAIAQTDDNDAYLIQYRDLADGSWRTLWDVPNFDEAGFGMQTRPNPEDDTAVFMFASTFRTDAVRFSAASGDDAYSVSEIQLFIPAPGALALLGMGALAATRRRR